MVCTTHRWRKPDSNLWSRSEIAAPVGNWRRPARVLASRVAPGHSEAELTYGCGRRNDSYPHCVSSQAFRIAFPIWAASGVRWRHEAVNKSIRCPAKDRPPVRVLAPQHGVIGYREPARIVGIVGKDQDLPTALLQPRLGRRAVIHRAARFSIRIRQRAVPIRQWIAALMRRGDPGSQDDADANRVLHILDRPAEHVPVRRRPTGDPGEAM